MIRELYRALLQHPGNVILMYAMADAWEMRGRRNLANAYRWAAQHRKWPHRRHGIGIRGFITSKYDEQVRWVYDWDHEERDSHYEPHARVPRPLYNAMTRVHGRKYGGPHRAFRLLAEALLMVRPLNGEGTWGSAAPAAVAQNGIVDS